MAKNDHANEAWEQFSEVLLQYGRSVTSEGEKLSGDSSRTGAEFSESRIGGPQAAADVNGSISNAEAMTKTGREASDFIDMAKRVLTLLRQAIYRDKEQFLSGEIPSALNDDIEDMIDIELADLRETGSKKLLNDLLSDSGRDGVALDQSRHGKRQPDALKRMLRNHNNSGLEKIAKHIHKKKNSAVLDYPANKIRFQT